jgi:hypothetical protein
MVIYSCNLCGKEFGQKCHYINHTEKRKKSCVNTLSTANIQNIPLCIPIQNPPKPTQITTFDVFKSYGNTGHIGHVVQENTGFSDSFDNFDKSILSDESEEKICCAYCLKTFCRKDVLNKHLKNSCKVKNNKMNKKRISLKNYYYKKAC